MSKQTFPFLLVLFLKSKHIVYAVLTYRLRSLNASFMQSKCIVCEAEINIMFQRWRMWRNK